MVAAAQLMCARAATRWRTASWWRAEAEAGPPRQRRQHCDGGAGGGLPDGGSGETPDCTRLFPSPVAAARSPQEAREEQGATAARWATAASVSACGVFIYGRGLRYFSSGGGGGYYGGGGGGYGGVGAAARVTRSLRDQRVLAKRRK